MPWLLFKGVSQPAHRLTLVVVHLLLLSPLNGILLLGVRSLPLLVAETCAIVLVLFLSKRSALLFAAASSSTELLLLREADFRT